ncbi:MAG TPA: hypothetical protein VGU25_01540 [Acidobacteriaceae bacterium]|nr:hypothetical protein [Acidobacteriaceae bacterium]
MLLRLITGLLCAAAFAASGQQVMSAHTLVDAIEQHDSSGTSIEPASTPVPMWMGKHAGWSLMLHANAFAADTQQQAQSPRNRDTFFSTNWIMPMTQHALGSRGRITLRTMLSLEPATVHNRNYPELFQQGETAFGSPIIDGQHPHNFFMELAALYDLKLSSNTLFSFYAAPVGDPAIGPTAYPHRLSASEDPIAALGHHQEDSTHIAYSVLTGGLTYRWVRLELSGFHGAEPAEARWHFAPSPNGHAIDSVSSRVTISPASDWTGQYSIAHIVSPEALYPHEDQQRQTASVMYHHTFRSQPASPMKMNGMANMPGMDMVGSTKAQTKAATSTMPMQMAPEPKTDLSTTLLWGRTRSLADNSKENSYLLEALLRFAHRNYVWTRMENAGRSNELLLTPGAPLPNNFVESPLGHVAAFTFGYDHNFAVGQHLLVAPGAQVTAYRAPAALRSAYGDRPTAGQFFIRFRVR